MKLKLKQHLIIAIILLFSVSNTSNARISLDQGNLSVPSFFDFNKIFSGLSLPGIDFTKNTQQIHQDVSNLPFQNYKTDITQFIFGQNNLLRGIYSFFIGIVKFIGGIVIWILEFILALIRRGLSFIS